MSLVSFFFFFYLTIPPASAAAGLTFHMSLTMIHLTFQSIITVSSSKDFFF